MKSLISVREALNIAIRALTMGSRFILTFAIARYLTPTDLGLFGLLGSTVAVAIYAVGLDFYTYTTREIIKSEKSQWGGMLKNHGALSIVLYVVVMPVLCLMFLFGLLPWSLAGWLILLLTLEHLGREINRLLIATSQQLLASVIMFLRKGAWIWIAVMVLIVAPRSRNLDFVFACWAIAAVIACVAGCVRIHSMRMGGWSERVDWNWIWRGVRISGAFLVATLAVQSLSAVDKYWVQSLVGPAVLGAYVLFSGLAVGMSSVLDAGVLSFSYPLLIDAHHRHDLAGFRREIRRMFWLTVAICAAFSIVVYALIDYLLVWIHKPIYLEHKSMLPWVLLATVFTCIAYTPHYGLYARGQDRQIIVAHVAGAILFVPAAWALSLVSPTLAVPVALCVAFGFILAWKSWHYLRGSRLPESAAVERDREVVDIPIGALVPSIPDIDPATDSEN